MTARRLDTYLVRDSDGTEVPMCRDCILESDGDARFEGDDWTEWEMKQDYEYGFDRAFSRPREQEDDLEDGYYGTLYRKDPRGRPCVWSEDKGIASMGEPRDQQRTLERIEAWLKALNAALREQYQLVESIPRSHWRRPIVERGYLAMYEHARRELCGLLGLEPCFILNLEGMEATRDEEPVRTPG